MVLAALSVLVGAAAQAVTGFGFALISGPALFAVLRPGQAVASLLVLGIVANVLALLGGRGSRSVRWPEVRVVVAAAVPGLLAGAVLVSTLPKAFLQVAVGVGVLVAVALVAVLPRRETTPVERAVPDPHRRPGWTAVGLGLTVGVLTTSTGTNGPPLSLWLERRGVPPREARTTIAAMFLALNVLGALALVLVGGGRGAGLLPSALGLLLAAELVGHVAGSVVFRRLGPGHFRVAGLVLATAAGLASVAAGLSG